MGALEAAALGIFLFLISKNLSEFIKNGVVLSFGFVLPHALTVGYFASKNLLTDYIFAAYTYYRIYLGESPKYALLINLLKFLPIVAVIIYGLFKKKQKNIDVSYLILLWIAFSFFIKS